MPSHLGIVFITSSAPLIPYSFFLISVSKLLNPSFNFVKFAILVLNITSGTIPLSTCPRSIDFGGIKIIHQLDKVSHLKN